MFPIVSYNINARPATPSEVTMSDITGSSKLLVPGRVTSATSIPQGAMSMPIQPHSLRGQPDVVQISVGVNSYGTIELENSSKNTWTENIHWIRALRLSDDCHSYNIQLKFVSSPKQTVSNKSVPAPTLILQCVRPINVGQELLLWFSEEILAMMQIVFLTPSNIQGQRKYVCTRCSALYESPNPLKLHVTLGCGKFTISWLWDKVSTLVSDTSKTATKSEFNFKLLPEQQISKQRSAIDLSVSNSTELNQHINDTFNIYRPFTEASHNSAFKPFQRGSENKNNNSVDTLTDIYYQRLPLFTFPQDYMQTQMSIGHEKYESEAQIETLVSSLGKSKQGHVCLYCGKFYSRKYGLKIHIRTHTGYKPLKCKYCLRPFGDPSNLNKHIRLHSAGDTPYKCDICGKVLVRRRDLERHLKSRHMPNIHPKDSVPVSEIENSLVNSDEDEEESIPID